VTTRPIVVYASHQKDMTSQSQNYPLISWEAASQQKQEVSITIFDHGY